MFSSPYIEQYTTFGGDHVLYFKKLRELLALSDWLEVPQS